ncbi:precorrin-3B C(17)-methyltransferase [Halodesulfurarchaeum sp.]|uniref:precorrin-3B C(17)-methyltransferase n=1 Tax=Halodesulfurarchaeum sp. TaxID=1980530 RepID=UPI001BC033AE|nr:cobalt-precorrin-2 C(20)-methyltransferase [Halodesulfurarchaeum sp.]
MTEWPTAEHLSRPAAGAESAVDAGKLQIVGIGPGLPEHLTQAARRAIQTADAIYAAPLYQEFLAQESLLSSDDLAGDGPTVIESTRTDAKAQARATFDRVLAGERVVHVSGGDPTVYGKSDLLVALAETESQDEIPIEVIPGVTAALGGAATLGAPLSNDFCTVSLSTNRRDQDEIDRKLEAAAEAGFVIALYNCWRSLNGALETISKHRSDSVPVALLEDVARGEQGRSDAGETVAIAPLVEADSVLHPETPGSLAIVGTEDSRVLRPTTGGQPFLVTPRGDETPLDF